MQLIKQLGERFHRELYTYGNQYDWIDKRWFWTVTLIPMLLCGIFDIEISGPADDNSVPGFAVFLITFMVPAMFKGRIDRTTGWVSAVLFFAIWITTFAIPAIAIRYFFVDGTLPW